MTVNLSQEQARARAVQETMSAGRHRFALCPAEPGSPVWQSWCYAVDCDWSAEGSYDEVSQQAAKHSGVTLWW